MTSLRKVLRRMASIGLLLGFQGFGALAGVASVLLLTTLLGIEEFGRYAWALSVASLAALFLQMGLPTTILKTYAPLDLRASLRPWGTACGHLRAS